MRRVTFDPTDLDFAPTAPADLRRDRNGTFLTDDGERTFQFGLYVGNPNADHVDVLAEAGFDFTYLFNSGHGRTAEYMDALDAAGLETIPHWISGDPGFVDRYEDHPALMAWGLHDDANWSSFTPAGFARDAAMIRAQDDRDSPIHTSVIGFDTARYPDYAAFLDSVEISNVQIYPFGRDESGIGIQDVFRAATKLVETAAATDTVPMHAGQAFGWDEAGTRVPTPAEQDAHFYTAVIAGVQGTTWYPDVSWASTDADPYVWEVHKDLWSSIVRNIAEMEVIEAAVTNGTRTTTDEGGGVYSALWEHDGEHLLIVTNGSDGAHRADVEVAAPSGATLRPVFADRPDTFALADGVATGRIGALETQIYRIVETEPEVALDADGFITVEGERFFPYGFYVEDKGTRDVRQTLDVLGEAGFNTVQIEPRDNERMERIFDKAEAEGIRVIYSPSKYVGPDGLGDVIADVSREPSLLGWTVGDDVRDGDMTGRPRDVTEVKTFNDAIKAIDPDHLTFAAIGGGTTETIYDARAWDISGQQIYPVNGSAPLDLVFDAISDVVEESAANGQTAVALLQAFNFGEGLANRPPTSAEFDNMLYQALVAGAQGVIYYSYDNFGDGIEFFPGLFAAAEETAAEVAVLEPFLLSGTHEVRDLGGDLVVGTWEVRDELVAAVVYTGDYQSFPDPATNAPSTRTVSFELPEGYAASAVQNLFDDGTFALSNDGGTVTGEIDLLDVQVARFEKTSGPAPTDVIGASGTATFRQTGPDAWTRVEFGATLEDAVVVLGPPTANGPQPTSVRVRDVDETGFEIQIDEWDYLDGAHTLESVGWMALEAGTHRLGDGPTIEAGWAEAGAGWSEVALAAPFDDAPAVFAAVLSPDGTGALVPRLRDVEAEAFDFRMDGQERGGADPAGSRIGYVAFETGAGAGIEAGAAGRIDHRGADVDLARAFDDDPVLLAAMQTTRGGDPAMLRLDALNGDRATLRMEEERSRDDEIVHGLEDVAYLATAAGLIEGQDLLA